MNISHFDTLDIDTMVCTHSGLLGMNDDILSAIVSYLNCASARQLSYTYHSLNLQHCST